MATDERYTNPTKRILDDGVRGKVIFRTILDTWTNELIVTKQHQRDPSLPLDAWQDWIVYEYRIPNKSQANIADISQTSEDEQ
jgi:hypothetical protein